MSAKWAKKNRGRLFKLYCRLNAVNAVFKTKSKNYSSELKKNATSYIHIYFENGKSPTLVKEVLKTKYPDVKHLSRKHIFCIVTKFVQYGDGRKDTCIRQRTGRSDENIEKGKTIT